MRDMIVMYGGSPVDIWPDPSPLLPSTPFPFPVGTVTIGAPPPSPPAHLRAAVLAGAAKLLPLLREQLRRRAEAGQPLDADEATAMAWLEGLAAGAP